MSKRLLVSLSSHGFGHLAQTAPVLNLLKQQLPDLYISIKSTLPLALLQGKLNFEFEHISHSSDFGMLMNSALDVSVDASIYAYQQLHTQWSEKLDEECRIIEAAAPDLMLANIPYLSCAAAAKLGVPSVAMCSLNWAHILEAYWKGPEFDVVQQQILDSYNKAEVFLAPEPSMDMPGLNNLKSIGPIASDGRQRGGEIRQQLGLTDDTRLVLVSAGGIQTHIPFAEWPVVPCIVWVTPQKVAVSRRDMVSLHDLDMPYEDVFVSMDAVVTKPGYGTIAEAVCNDIPVLYVKRNDWPEEPALLSWLHEHGRALEVSRDDFFKGELEAGLKRLWHMPVRGKRKATGILQAVGDIRVRL